MFLTIVDDYTRTTWLFLLKYKNQCVRFLTHFVSFVQNQFNSSVKTIRTDNAKELCEGDIWTFYQQKGFYIKDLVDTPHNKMGLWNEIINT